MKKDKNLELESNGLVVFIISAIAGLVNYRYQIIMGNMMHPEEYGLLNTLFSLMLVVSVPAGTMGVISLKYTSYSAANNNSDEIPAIYKKLSLIAAVCGVVTFLAGCLMTEMVGNVLKISDKTCIAIVMFAAGLEYVIYVNKGILQGLKRFIPFSLLSIISASGKILFSIILISAGFGLYGATFSMILASAASIVYAFIVLRKNILPFPEGKVKLNEINLSHYFRYIIWTQIFLLLLTSGDVILVKLFADDYMVGVYSSVAVLCKISYYFANSIASTLLPIVAQNHSRGEKTYNLFIRSVVYSLVVSVACAMGISLFGDFIIGILFGSDYSSASLLFVPVSFFIISLNLITVLINYQTAVEDMKFLTKSLIIGFISTITAVFLFSNSIPQIMYVLGLGLSIIFITNFIAISIKNKNSN